MKLKDKTHRKFVEFFADKSRANGNAEFEMAFAEIQRSTGTASVTLKKALNALVEEGIIKMVPGRNSRYAKFTVINPENIVPPEASAQPVNPPPTEAFMTGLEQEVDLLKRRLRSQEIAIALLQDRLADLEEKLKG